MTLRTGAGSWVSLRAITAVAAAVATATLLAACSSSSSSSSSSSTATGTTSSSAAAGQTTIGVDLTYNDTAFWAAYCVS